MSQCVLLGLLPVLEGQGVEGVVICLVSPPNIELIALRVVIVGV